MQLRHQKKELTIKGDCTMKVDLKNRNTEEVKQVKVGYSWTVFFWGFIPSLFRKDWIGALSIFVLNLFVSYLVGPCGLLIADTIIGALYNKNYIGRLLKDGYVPIDDKDKLLLKQKNLNY